MRRTVLLYGLLGGVLIVILKLAEYRFLVVEHSLEIYGGLVAAIFASLGIWLGLKLTRPKEVVVMRDARPFVVNQAQLQALGITSREHEILTLIASGLSNREAKSNFAHLAVLHAAGQHIILAPPNYAMVGQAFLGADMRATPLRSAPFKDHTLCWKRMMSWHSTPSMEK